MRSGSLWRMYCNFLERSNFSLKYLNWVQDLSWVLEFKHLKAHNFCNTGVFSSIIISQLIRPIEFKFSQVCYFMHMLNFVPLCMLVWSRLRYGICEDSCFHVCTTAVCYAWKLWAKSFLHSITDKATWDCCFFGLFSVPFLEMNVALRYPWI